MLRFGKMKVAKEDFYGPKKQIKVWNVNVDNIVISKLVDIKNNSEYFIGYLDDHIRPLVWILSKIFRDKGWDKNKNNKLMSLRIDHDKLLKKYKIIWTKIEDLKNIELDALPVYDVRYIKAKIRTYGDQVYTIFCGLNVPKDGAKCESFTVISIDSLLVYKVKCYPQVYLENCAYKIVDKQMIDYLDDNLFETDEEWLFYFKNGSYKCCITIELIQSK